ncbi:biopolymer transporter ExbD [Poseidonocella sp. HB161398]|uniref:ExbD/TolR family protein n=1 Tax=Poseidonocella sp. HB161398 TaxID=2320855 RepID=UPI0011099CB8|nr:biopolymer transporter ExbD [Poseidonocella sp. HB161398]
MSRRRLPAPRRASEPTLALINIVFLMLIFFLVAAQLARPLERGLQLVETADPRTVAPPDALVLGADGGIRFRGQAATAESAYALLAGEGAAETVRVMPDRAAEARRVVALAGALKALGAGRILIVTGQARP